MKCIHRLSTKTVKNGFDNKGFQSFKCNGCGKRFCEKRLFSRFRHLVSCRSLRECGQTFKLRKKKSGAILIP